MRCPKCNTLNSDISQICNRCGFVFESEKPISNDVLKRARLIAIHYKCRKCPNCGSTNIEIDRISPFFNSGNKWKYFCRECRHIWKSE